MNIETSGETEERVSSNPVLGGGAVERERRGCGTRNRRKKRKRASKSSRGAAGDSNNSLHTNTCLCCDNSCNMGSPLNLHSCPHPWRHGDRGAPVQLCNSSPSEVHHRRILAILNRITNAKVPELVSQATSMLMPRDGAENVPNITAVRKDLVQMLLEKAQDEMIFVRDYCCFLYFVSCEVDAQTRVLEEAPSDDLVAAAHLAQLAAAEPLREIIQRECVRKYRLIYNLLRDMYTSNAPFSCSRDTLTRQRFNAHVKLMVLLHLRSLLPWEVLTDVRDELAGPLLNDGNEAVAIRNDAGIEVEVDGNRAFNEEEGLLAHEDNNLEVDLVNLNLNDGDEQQNNSNNDNRNAVLTSSSVTLQALSAELLAVFLYHLGDLNNVVLNGVYEHHERLCELLRTRMRSLSSRQMFVIMRTLDLRTNGWREDAAPLRHG